MLSDPIALIKSTASFQKDPRAVYKLLSILKVIALILMVSVCILRWWNILEEFEIGTIPLFPSFFSNIKTKPVFIILVASVLFFDWVRWILIIVMATVTSAVIKFNPYTRFYENDKIYAVIYTIDDLTNIIVLISLIACFLEDIILVLNAMKITMQPIFNYYLLYCLYCIGAFIKWLYKKNLSEIKRIPTLNKK